MSNAKLIDLNLKTILVNSFDFSDSDFNEDGATFAEQAQEVLKSFDSEFNCYQNKIRYPNTQERVAAWLQGLPSQCTVPFYNSDALKLNKTAKAFLKLLKVDPLHPLKGERIFLSFSGGRTSGYQVETLLSEGLHLHNEVVILFANTGWEHPKTLKFVNECTKRWKGLYNLEVVWVEAKVHHNERKANTHNIVCFETASRNREPFEESIKKFGVPNNGYPWCTRDLKENPIRDYLVTVKGWEKGSYYTLLGMRSDEIQRVIGQAVVNFGKKYSLDTKKLLQLRRTVYKYRSHINTINSVLSGMSPAKKVSVTVTKAVSVECGYGRVVSVPQNTIKKVKAVGIKDSYYVTMSRFIRRYLKSIGLVEYEKEDFKSLVGRILNINDKQNKCYPLVDWMYHQPDKLYILDWWEEMPFDLDIEEWQGNCYGCYKKSSKKLLKAIRDDEALFSNTLEIDYGHIGPNKIKGKFVEEPRTMYRESMTCQSMIALFKQTPSAYLKDRDDEIEVESSGCSSSCEAFGGDT